MHRKPLLTLIGVAASLSSAIFLSNSASAATLNPSLSIEAISPAVSDTTLEFKGASERASAEYNIPVKISYQDIKDLTITFYATNDMTSSVGTENTKLEVDTGYTDTISLFDYNSTNQTTDETKKLHSIPTGESKAISQMPDMWGYRYKLANTSTDVSTESYTAMPTSTSPLQLDTLSIANNTLPIDNATGRGEEYLNFGFAASVTKAQTSGTYAGRAIVSAVASPNYITLYDMQERHMTMQQMSSDICDNTPTPAPTATEPATSLQDLKNSIITDGEYRGLAGKIPQVGLEDHRQVGTKDGQPVYYSYLVAKLADENCWMRQNLALTGGTTISSADSDITDESLPASLSNMGEAGKYKLPISSVEGFDSPDVGYMYNGSFLPNTYNTIGYSENQSIDGANCNSSIGCNGTNSGAYYSWLTVTSGTGGGEHASYTNARSSICPKNWKLPTNGNIGNSADSPAIANGEVPKLYNTYGSESAFSVAWLGVSTSNASTGYFAFNKLNGSGENSHWWSSTIFDNQGGRYVMWMLGNGFEPAHRSDDYGGFSVRCIAR